MIGIISYSISKHVLNLLAEKSLKNDVNFALKMITNSNEKVEKEEQTAAIEQISASEEDLAKLAEFLQNKIHTFKV